jgi:peptide/nickel transport system permease protein
MKGLVLRRVAALPLILLAVAMMTFTITEISPYDAVEAYVGAESSVSEAEREIIARNWGLDRSAPERFLRWLGNLVQGDLGSSISHGGQPVSKILSARVGPSIVLMAGSLSFVLLGGLVAGVLAAAFKGSWIDWLIRGLAYFNISAPSFWVALLALYVFAIRLHVLPGAGAADMRALDPPALSFSHLILPMMVLALTQHAWFTMFVRNTLLEVMQEDYVRYATAQGISRPATLFRHALPNATIPFLTLAGIHLSELIGGSVLIENIFGWPGIGALVGRAALAVDIPLLLAITLIGSAMIVTGNLVADLSYRIVDPRIRESLR